jgi:hypothetical protein
MATPLLSPFFYPSNAPVSPDFGTLLLSIFLLTTPSPSRTRAHLFSYLTLWQTLPDARCSPCTPLLLSCFSPDSLSLFFNLFHPLNALF